MTLRRIMSLVCSIACTASLAIGYGMTGQSLAWLALIVMVGLIWLYAWRTTFAEIALVALIVSVALAAVGLLIHAAPVLMILGATLALASWDLLLFDHALLGSSSSQAVVLLIQKHYASLALALTIGGGLALLGRLIQIQLPFALIVALVILACWGFDRIERVLIN